MRRALLPADDLIVILERCEEVADKVRAGVLDLDSATFDRIIHVRNEARAELPRHAKRVAVGSRTPPGSVLLRHLAPFLRLGGATFGDVARLYRRR